MNMNTLNAAFGVAALVVGAVACGQDPAVEEPAFAESDLSARPVAISEGKVRGTRDGGVMAFRGVPYAAPPVGDLRWRPPAPPEAWDGVLDADRFPSPCVQIDHRRGGGVSGSEDCLYLNVWAPTKRGSPRPVMVFVHGGGNLSGSTSEVMSGATLYDGARLAERGDVIVVTLQYRLGMLGYFADPQLAAEVPQRASGNYGLLDQLAALHWVQRNIEKFGGDKDHVLLFGESGGGTDVCALYASPLAKGSFSSAVIQSGDCEGGGYDRAPGWRREFVRNAGCGSDLACLRALPAETIALASETSATTSGVIETPAGPIVDGYVLPDMPIELVRRGEHTKVPLVIGVNAVETAAPLFTIPRRLTGMGYLAALRSMFGADADRVRYAYPLVAFDTPRDALVAVTTDSQFVCPARRFARAAARSQRAPVYRYLYTHVMEGKPSAAYLGAAHGLELFSVFQKVDEMPDYPPTRADYEMEDITLGYWTRFARTGDPNGAGATFWESYDPVADTFLALESPPEAREALSPLRCDLFDSLAGM